MAYEYEEFIDAMRFGLTMSDRDTTDDIWKMVDEVVNKARAFDEILKNKSRIETVKDITLMHATDEPFNDDMYTVHTLLDSVLDVIKEQEANDES